MKIDRRILKLIKAVPFGFALVLVGGIITALLALVQAASLARIVSGLFLESQPLDDLKNPLVVLVCALAGRVLFTFLSDSAAKHTAVRVKASLRQQLIALGLSSRTDQVILEGPGEMSAAIIEGVEALDGYISQFVPQIVLSVTLPLAILIWVFPVDFISGLVFVLTAPLIPVFMILIGGASEKAANRQWQALSRMSGFFLDLLQGLTTLRTMGQSNAQINRVEEVSQRYRQTTMTVLRITFLSALILEMVAAVSTAVVAVEIGLRLLYSQLDFERAFFILLVAPEFYQPLRQLGARFHASTSGYAAAQKIFKLLESVPAAPTMTPVVYHTQNSAQPHPLDQDFRIRFERVNYHYGERDRAGVEDLTFEVQRGETIALVGESGSGKTTLLRLVERFIEPETGKIVIAGQGVEQNIADIGLEHWRTRISWIPQKGTILGGTVAENLRIAKESAGESELIDVLDALGLVEWLSSLPAGLDTPLGEGGTTISAGQAQRFSLARALLKNAPLVLMDEPTAHLDPETEDHIRPVMDDVTHNCTVLVAAHHLSTVSRADRILVFERGRIVEQGSHLSLLQAGGLYAQFLSHYQEGC